MNRDQFFILISVIYAIAFTVGAMLVPYTFCKLVLGGMAIGAMVSSVYIFNKADI